MWHPHAGWPTPAVALLGTMTWPLAGGRGHGQAWRPAPAQKGGQTWEKGTRPTVRNKHSSNSQELHKHEQSYPRTDMTSQTQRLLIISVYPTDWVCFMPLCVLRVRVCVCVCVCVCVRVHSSASVSACACMSARIGAPVFVCMCVSACVSLSTGPSHLSREVVLANLSSRAGAGWGGDVKINTHTHTHARRWIPLKKGGREAKKPRTAGALIPSYSPIASLPNTTEKPLRQNARTKLDHHPATPLGPPPAYFFLPITSAASASLLHFVSDHSCDSWCLPSSIVSSYRSSSPGIRASSLSSVGLPLTTGLFFFSLFFFNKVDINMYVFILFFFSLSINACFCTHMWKHVL